MMTLNSVVPDNVAIMGNSLTGVGDPTFWEELGGKVVQDHIVH